MCSFFVICVCIASESCFKASVFILKTSHLCYRHSLILTGSPVVEKDKSKEFHHGGWCSLVSACHQARISEPQIVEEEKYWVRERISIRNKIFSQAGNKQFVYYENPLQRNPLEDEWRKEKNGNAEFKKKNWISGTCPRLFLFYHLFDLAWRSPFWYCSMNYKAAISSFVVEDGEMRRIILKVECKIDPICCLEQNGIGRLKHIMCTILYSSSYKIGDRRFNAKIRYPNTCIRLFFLIVMHCSLHTWLVMM